MGRAWGWGLAAMMAACLAAGTAAAACSLSQFALLPVTMTDRRPLTTAKINGADVTFEIDSGADYSLISPSKAAELHLRLEAMAMGFETIAVGGAVVPRLTTVDHFNISGADLRDIQFLVGGSEVGEDTVGLLGENFLSLRDVEFDLAHGVVRLFVSRGCGSAPLVYWPHDSGFGQVDLKPDSDVHFHSLRADVLVNGVKLVAEFDTGASSSGISLSAAKHAGIAINGPGVEQAGVSRGVGGSLAPTWIAPVDSIEIGGETIKRTKIRILDLDSRHMDIDMLIGADFFLSHRVYVANSQHRLYFTYAGGPIFLLDRGQTASVAAAGPPAAAAGPAPATVDAEALGRRGAASASRRDFVAAIADLTRAVDAAPTDTRWLKARAEAYMESGKIDAAAADLDRALKLAPDDVQLHLDRARVRLARRDKPGAVADLDAIDKLSSKPADVRFDLMALYLDADAPAASLAQSQLWLAAHPEDSRYGLALLDRAAARVLLNQDLDKVLVDCAAASRRQADPAKLAEVRALAHMRRDEWDAAIAEYDRALAIRPKDAELLYGRGQAKRRKGAAKDGDADIAAAVAADPEVVQFWKRYGLDA